MKKLLFVDVETSALKVSKNSFITQLAYYYENGKKKGFRDIKKDIYKTFVGDLDKFVDRYDKTDKMYLIGYNINFDAEWMRAMFIRNKNEFFGSYFFYPPIDVMQLAAYKFMKNNIHPENFKLATVCKQVGIRVDDKNLHDAMYDISITRQLYNKLIKIKG